MAKQSGLGDQLYVQGVDLSGDVGSVGAVVTRRAALHDVTGINATAVERITGLGDGEISFNSWFNDGGAANRAAGAGSSFVALSALPTTDVYAMYCRGSTLSAPAAGLQAKQVNHDPTMPQGGPLAMTTQVLGAAGYPLEWGNLVTAGKITHASASTTTGEVGTSSALGAIGYLQVFSVATGTPTFVVQTSSDTTNGVDGTWANAIVFATTAAGAERKTVTGTVDKGLRVRTFGTFTNAVFAVMVRRGEAGDDVSLA